LLALSLRVVLEQHRRIVPDPLGDGVKLSTPDLIFGNDLEDNNARAKVEILAQGQQFVGFGIHPNTKAPYS
jgi:hypothetical protein